MSDIIGKELGSYRILEQIGVGGMATVYKAYHAAMDRYVAIKVLPEQMSKDVAFRKRFEREAKVIAKLEHAHILPVYYYGEAGERLYLVMRYIEAGTLKERMAAGPLDLPEINRVLRQVCNALAYAHRLGVVHRDIKPANVLLDAQGDCYLTDFGLAKMMEASVQLTKTGVGLGTPAYMSPEQGQGEKVGSRSDIYSLGVVLYELVTGQVPYHAETPLAVVLKHITAPLPLPSEVKHDVHPAIERVILRALAKNPDDRFATTDEMATAFERALAEAKTLPVVTSPPAGMAAEPSQVAPALPGAPPIIETIVTEEGLLVPRRRAVPWWGLALGGVSLLVLLGVILVATGVLRPFAEGTPTVEPMTPQPTAVVISTAQPPTPVPGSPAEEARTFAEPILAAITDRPPDYEEDFSDPGSGWPAGSEAEGDEWGYQDGAYTITAVQTRESIGGGLDRALWLSDFVLEVDAQFVLGTQGLWYVLFRDSSETVGQPHYGVGFGPDGVFWVWKNVNRNHIELMDQAGDASTFWPNSVTNHLTLVVKGSQIAVFMNEEPLQLVSDESLSQGGIQLGIANQSGDSPFQVRFDNLKVWDISEAPADVVTKWTYDARDPIWYLDSWGDGLAAGDLNDDGIADIVFGTRAGVVIAVDGESGKELWSYQVSTQSDAPVSADVVDVDDDGVVDVVAAGKGDATSQGQAIIRALDKNGTFKWQALGDYEEVSDLAYGDVDGDGDTDVVTAVGTYPWGGGQVILLDGATGDRVWVRSLGGGHAQGLDTRDLDGDGTMEVAVENYDNQVFLLDGGSGDILWTRSKEWYGRDVIIQDVDDDGMYEIVSGGGAPISYDSNGNQEWTSATEGMNISSGDVNGDGHTEVMISSSFGGEFYVLEGGTGKELWTRARAGVHAVGDVDGDGIDDIVVGTIRLYGIEPPYYLDALDGVNNLLWSYPLDDIFNEGGFGLAMANLDSDPALEVLVANGTQLLALDGAAVTPAR